MVGNKVKIIALHHAEKPFKGKPISTVSRSFYIAYLFHHDAGMEWVKSIIKNNKNN
jgi:hypothetical protein